MHDILGSGSFATIHVYLREWRKKNPDVTMVNSQASVKLTKAIEAEIAERIKETRIENQEINESLQSENEQLNNIVLDLQQSVDDLKAERDQLLQKIANLETANLLITQQLAETKQILFDMQNKNIEIERKNASLSTQLDLFGNEVKPAAKSTKVKTITNKQNKAKDNNLGEANDG